MTDRDEELLKALASAARAEDRASDPRWSARVHGALAQGELDALEALAQRSAEDREAWEASRPLDGEARARIADNILGVLQANGAERGAPAASAPRAETTGVPLAEPTAAPRSPASSQAAPAGRVIPLAAAPGRRRWIAAAAVLAAAAAWALVARLGPGRQGGATGDPGALALLDAPAPVPDYAVSIAGGEAGQRSANGDAVAPGTARLGPGSRLEIALRPATRVEGPVAVRAFLIAGDKALPWDVRPEVSAQGAARIAGDTEALFRGVPEGEWEIAIAIGRPEALPDRPAELADGPPGEGENPSAFRVLRAKVRLLPGAAPPPPAPPPQTP
ncbi:hypothetical protein [Sorangium cellulosum]|uniref:hypothetical protein n=1 Tax=Sorangium cellulosum TaxID=56 RepID=UPI00041D365E|nr:hypothetical protein [Sorangium cellulosum]